MKKVFSILLTLIILVILFASCNNETKTTTVDVNLESEAENISQEPITIDLWTFPVGNFGDAETIEEFIANFNAVYPHITVNYELLNYSDGDAKIEQAINDKTTPDIILEGPERLVANWGERGLMVDLSELMTDRIRADINSVSPAVLHACETTDSELYEYPIVMTTHCMAINYDVFEQAGALQYIDENSRSWTTDNFVLAMEAVRDSGLVDTPGIIYCGGQGGDQGTRALVTNLYSAPFVNDTFDEYIINEENGVKALSLLNKMALDGSLSFDTTIQASDELALFSQGKTAVTLAWNSSNEAQYAEDLDFNTFAMNFPSDDGMAELQGGIWGFGVFDNGDEAKIEASKTFIEFMANDDVQGPKSVAASGFFPVRTSYSNVYAGTDDEHRMADFAQFTKNLGTYYQISAAWTEQRVEWYKMLQSIAEGNDIKEAANEYNANLNYIIFG